MVGRRSRAGILVFLGIALLLAACGENAAPTSGSGGGSSPAKEGKVGIRTISGLGAVLQTPAGFTLYRLKTEGTGTPTCTGDCAVNWPPLLAASGKVPAASPDVAAHLGTVERPDGGTQVTFDGMPLHTYAGDSGPGQANGQGVGGVWFAVTATAQSTSGSGYPGY